jgi:hypothetical protein
VTTCRLALAIEQKGSLATLDRGLFEMARAKGGVFLIA